MLEEGKEEEERNQWQEIEKHVGFYEYINKILECQRNHETNERHGQRLSFSEDDQHV